jgi:hypothetical protein
VRGGKGEERRGEAAAQMSVRVTDNALEIRTDGFPKAVSSFIFSLGGVRLIPFGMPATIWPTVPAPDDG